MEIVKVFSKLLFVCYKNIFYVVVINVMFIEKLILSLLFFN